MTKFFAPAIAIATGLLVLLGYFLPNNILVGVRTLLVQWVVLLSGAAVLLGVYNLLSVHIKKIIEKGKEKVYSFLLVISLLLTLALGLWQGTSSPIMKNVFNAVILPVESSLLAIMAVTLIYAGIRLFRQRNDWMAIVFVLSALIMILNSAPPFVSLFPAIRPFFMNTLAVGGVRGILLGVALGTLLTGLRVLLGTNRPYGGK